MLPLPIRGGSLEALNSFFNLPTQTPAFDGLRAESTSRPCDNVTLEVALTRSRPMNSSPIPTQYRHFIRHVWWLVPICVVLAITVAWMARAPILRDVAELWVVSDPLARADAIVILSGRLDVRPFAAAALYKRGMAHQVLFSRAAPGPIDALRLLPKQTELNRQILGKLGVPDEAMVEFGQGVSSTYDEARALVDWVRSSGARSLIIPTDLFTTRRIRWIFQRQLDPMGVRVMVQAIEPPEYKLDGWWRSENGLIEFQNEVIKFVYYRLKY